LRKAAIITLVASGLTLIAAIIIASVDLQNLSTQSSSPQNFAPKQSFGPPLEFPGKTAPPNSLKK
jgi:hypothetical protein